MKVITLFIVGTLLLQCSKAASFYLRNTLDVSVLIKARLYDEESKGDIFYAADVQEISFGLKEILNKKLEPVKREDDYLFFELPANATFFVSDGVNSVGTNFSEIEIYSSDTDTTILNRTNFDLWEYRKSAYGYDIR